MQLRPYQEEAAAWLARSRRAYLADVMGLGKTPVTCSAAARVRPTTTLVICPAVARPVWREHLATWAPGLPHTILSYDAVVRHPLTRLPDLVAELVILDEAHYAKSRTAARTKRALWLAAQARHAWFLSGTPMPNHPGELFAPAITLWPERVRADGIRTYRQWLDAFCLWSQNEWGGVRVYGTRNADRLRQLLFGPPPGMMRRKEADVDLQLPPLDTYVVPIEAPLTPELIAAQQAARVEWDGERAPQTPVQATARRLAGEAKAPAVAKLLSEELADGAYRRIVVFAYHHSVLDAFQRQLLPYFGAVRIDGNTSEERRVAVQREFAAEGGPRVLLGQTQACGVALTITAADQVAIVEPSWTPEEDHQAIKRIHRYGQTRRCTARLFALTNTLDEDILRVRERKIQMLEEVLP